MNDLFADKGTPAKPGTEKKRFEWLAMFCREKFGAPDDWRWYSWERKNFDSPHEFLLVSGAVCHAKFEKGKRKGQTNWKLKDKSTDATYAVRQTELAEFQQQWSERTGECFECYGTGEQWAGWSADKGSYFRPCRKCSATGRYQAAAA